MSPPTHGVDRPPSDSPIVRVLGPSLRERNLPGSVAPLRQLAAERPEDGTVLRVLEAVELLVDSLKAHAASVPGSKLQRTMPMVGLDHALFQVGMGNIEQAEQALRELARTEPDNDVVGRHLEAVQILVAALSGELTRSSVSIPEAGDERATSWDEGTEVQGDEDDPFALLDEPPGAQPPPAAQLEPPVADVTGRFAMPEAPQQPPAASSGPRATMDATPHARHDRAAADPEGTRVDKRRPERAGPASYRRLCEDHGSVLVRPVIAVG